MTLRFLSAVSVAELDVRPVESMEIPLLLQDHRMLAYIVDDVRHSKYGNFKQKIV